MVFCIYDKHYISGDILDYFHLICGNLYYIDRNIFLGLLSQYKRLNTRYRYNEIGLIYDGQKFGFLAYFDCIMKWG